jgi:hypothetical protein
MHKFLENLKVVFGDSTASLGAESSDVITTAKFVDMANYDIVEALGLVSNATSDAVVSLKMYEATDTDGSGSATITGASDTFTSTNTTDTDVLRAQVRASDLSAGYQFVGAKLSSSEAGDSAIAAVCLVQAKPRYGGATLP